MRAGAGGGSRQGRFLWCQARQHLRASIPHNAHSPFVTQSPQLRQPSTGQARLNTAIRMPRRNGTRSATRDGRALQLQTVGRARAAASPHVCQAASGAPHRAPVASPAGRRLISPNDVGTRPWTDLDYSWARTSAPTSPRTKSHEDDAAVRDSSSHAVLEYPASIILEYSGIRACSDPRPQHFPARPRPRPRVLGGAPIRCTGVLALNRTETRPRPL